MSTAHKIDPSALGAVIATEKKHHGAPFTVRSKDTGKDYTYKISRSQYQNRWFTHIRVETRYLNFDHIGVFVNGGILKQRQPVETPAASAIAWVLRQVEKKQFDKLSQSVEIMHTGKCICCGRELTDAESIDSGLGPICRKGWK